MYDAILNYEYLGADSKTDTLTKILKKVEPQKWIFIVGYSSSKNFRLKWPVSIWILKMGETPQMYL